MKEIAASRPRFGCKRIHTLLKREGWILNKKKTHRIYKELSLQLTRRKRPKRGSHNRIPASMPKFQNERWGMDFVTDRLEDGRRFRILTIIDLFTRKCPKLWADYSITADKVVKVLEEIKAEHGMPKIITVDNGPEFISTKLDSWAYYYGVKMDFIRPGKPVDNTFTESFNSRLRDECLNSNVFYSIKDAVDKLEAWRVDYNTTRPHSSLGDATPDEFAERFNNLKKLTLEVV